MKAKDIQSVFSTCMTPTDEETIKLCMIKEHYNESDELKNDDEEQEDDENDKSISRRIYLFFVLVKVDQEVSSVIKSSELRS